MDSKISQLKRATTNWMSLRIIFFGWHRWTKTFTHTWTYQLMTFLWAEYWMHHHKQFFLCMSSFHWIVLNNLFRVRLTRFFKFISRWAFFFLRIFNCLTKKTILDSFIIITIIASLVFSVDVGEFLSYQRCEIVWSCTNTLSCGAHLKGYRAASTSFIRLWIEICICMQT